MTTVEVLREAAADVGEGPTWDAATQTLVWVDVHGCAVHREDLAGGFTSTVLDRHVGAALPSATAGELLLVLRDGFYTLGPDGPAPIATPLADRPEIRFNDGKVDPRGRAFGGTMPYDTQGDRAGALYRLDPPGVATVCVDPVKLANGMGWTSDERSMYFVDSGTHQVHRYAYDVETGTMAAAELFLECDPAQGMPDGLTIDHDDCVWIAFWGAGQIRRFTPQGQLDRVVDLPITQPTSMCFAGPDLSTLVITSARFSLDEPALAAQPLAGALFAVDVGCSGPAATPWNPLNQES